MFNSEHVRFHYLNHSSEFHPLTVQIGVRSLPQQNSPSGRQDSSQYMMQYGTTLCLCEGYTVYSMTRFKCGLTQPNSFPSTF